MKNIMKKSVLTLMLLFTFCLMGSVNAKAASSYNAISVSNISDTRATINWVYNGSARYSHVYLSTDNVNYFMKDWSVSSSETLTGLAPNTTYYVRVREATDSNEAKGTNVWSGVATFTTLPTTPDRPTGLIQTGATNNSVTIAWNPATNATAYRVYVGDVAVAEVAATTVTIPNLPENGTYSFSVSSIAANASGAVESSKTWSESFKTTPAKTPAIGITNLYDAINVAYFGCSLVNADGYELAVYNSNGKIVHDMFGSSSIRVANFKTGTFYKYRIRGYITLSDGTKVFGPWSGYKYSGTPKKYKAVSYGRKIKVTWSKVSGAKKYTIYVSTKEKSGFKKFKKLSSSKKSCIVTKCGKSKLKKGKKYYIKLVVTGKDKKTSNDYVIFSGRA